MTSLAIFAPSSAKSRFKLSELRHLLSVVSFFRAGTRSTDGSWADGARSL